MNLNILGESVRLPNPIGRLANKLLGSVDSKLGQFGVNIDFKAALGKLFHLPTAGGDVKVPDLKSRLAAGDFKAPGAQAVGGGAVNRSFAAAGASAVGGASASAATSAQPGALDSSDQAMVDSSNKLSGQLDDIYAKLNSTDPAKAGDLARLQGQIQNINRMLDLISNLMKSKHDTAMAMIMNMK